MALPSTGTISLLNIQTEFGGSNPISLSEYYMGGNYVAANTGVRIPLTTQQYISILVPTTGTISLDKFRGTSTRTLTTLTSSGTYTVPNNHYLINVLIVAGGGSGGAEGSQWNGGGGGGAGGVIYVQNLAVTPGQTFSYSVGAGGAAVYNTQGTTGVNTTFGGYTALGGGGGGGWLYSSSNPTYTAYDKNNNPYTAYTYRQFDGLPGGSGGGGSSYYGQGRSGAGTSGQGNNGGTGAYDNGYNGGGGGYGGVGYSTAEQTTYSGGFGGIFTFTINNVTSTTVYVAGGGGAGGGFEHGSYGPQASNRFAYPDFGGGDGGSGGQSGVATPGISGTANKGGGGGGAGGASPSNSGNYYAGNGGSGVIYVLSRFG